ncbi:hypothetical protein SAMN05421771_2162 [Granulicella pectinivorans]|uniref:Uncharacterized protein n=2 Tax=Granulicella pectinivorans TaxID=474950 RepID=A0A1I6MAH3_9BACT|nr:hypothetical protein SAMN05421771_2162 [Granulicella pectinivorans]
MHLICRRCSTRLTGELKMVPFDTRNEAVEENFLDCGTSMLAEKVFDHDDRAGNYIANIADGQHMKLTDDSRRLNGCCGLDGCDGPNLQCELCGTYVATKRTDCWTPHYIVFDQSTTQAMMSFGE